MKKIGTALMATTLAACGASEPRSVEYFEAHLDEARAIVAACEKGESRGDECGNASIAVETADAKERFKRFRGK